ncbi:MAG: hypothetical protein ACD_79C00503G0002 [uncultured bacterium]|nr:MAG: hypothetical protein ACD_79C00503G0002 [uncultured bacterium]
MSKKNSFSEKEKTLKLVDELFLNFDDLSIDFSQENEIDDMSDISSQFINFQVGKEFYALEIINVLEIIKVPKISFLPSAGKYILGLINLRGNIIPVVNTHKLFGVSALTTPDKARIIIVLVERSTIGFLVDGVSQVIELNKDKIDSPMVTLEVENIDYIKGETSINGQLIAILDICRLVKNEIFVQQINKN